MYVYENIVNFHKHGLEYTLTLNLLLFRCFGSFELKKQIKDTMDDRTPSKLTCPIILKHISLLYTVPIMLIPTPN